ncbi:unnamed protein product (mitochondrion) [Plasmodiophora brassicae]|uniref:FAD-binding domain-containing protein n=1 Tax=Plasmodiophora brassicae TaxID=37360 RepID=A0A0G4IS83_PLABS|nr:hypothetical protein PBRA_006090 [Plasmodiophora brassicae]SPQ98190.1 unnamed protein product [Plasmodiophora brassicae]
MGVGVEPGPSVSARFWSVVRLGRVHMTMFSAVTYLCGVAIGVGDAGAVDVKMLLFAYMFVFSCQMVAHYTGEFYDLSSDRLNRHGTRLTGGSRVLSDPSPSSKVDPIVSLYIAAGFAIYSAALVACVLPPRVAPLAIAMLALAHQYSSPPLMLNHRALGEVTAALVQNVLLPVFAAWTQTSDLSSIAGRLLFLIVPSFFIKFALFVVLNLNDRRPDWLAGKVTIPVLVGDRASSVAHSTSLVLAYLSMAALAPTTASFALAVLSAPRGIEICRMLWHRPYRFDSVVARSLVHCTLPVWAFLFETVCRRLLHRGVVDLHVLIVAVLFVQFVRSAKSFPKAGDVDPRKPDRTRRVVIAGAGIGGLVTAITLHKQGIPCIVYERRPASQAEDGADLALWPSAVHILRTLGVPSSFWTTHTHVVDKVVMRRMSDASTLNRVDMSAVVRGTGERFRLVSRRPLLHALRALLPSDLVQYNVEFVGILPDGRVQIRHLKTGDDDVVDSHLLIGADGTGSAVRRATIDSVTPAKYVGEMCYRGVVDLNSSSGLRDAFENLLAGIPPSTMVILYGAGLRSSVGYIDDGSSRSSAYWWVKQVAHEGTAAHTASWPADLRVLYDKTPGSQRYSHRITDRDPGTRWSSQHSVLVGDAAHPITPNMGQGACLAIEDAFILATGIGKYGSYADGDIEARYQYEQRRMAFVKGVARSSHMQSIIGQVSNPILVWLRDNLFYKLPATFFISKLRSNNFAIADDLSEFRRLVAANHKAPAQPA